MKCRPVFRSPLYSGESYEFDISWFVIRFSSYSFLWELSGNFHSYRNHERICLECWTSRLCCWWQGAVAIFRGTEPVWTFCVLYVVIFWFVSFSCFYNKLEISCNSCFGVVCRLPGNSECSSKFLVYLNALLLSLSCQVELFRYVQTAIIFTILLFIL